MEARWQGKEYAEALAAAIPESDNEFDEITAATLAAMLAGYYRYYAADPVKEMHPEVEFFEPITGSRTFQCGGKIDGIGVLYDGRQVMIEHKTASESLDADSDYWLRLRFCGQLLQYVPATRRQGWNITEVLYDVTRKPSIAPKNINSVDENGKKIVVDADGVRVFKSNGDPRETGDAAKGYILQSQMETPDEFCDRLIADCEERPEFYFCRREVPILDQDIQEFEVQRLELSRLILNYRRAQKRVAAAYQAWPRNCNGMTCRMCQFRGFCLQNITVSTNNIPAGFVIGAINNELQGAN
jgi:hypothetical protein